MKVKYRPQYEFPHFAEASKLFPIPDGACFTYGDIYYTNFSPIPASFLVHEQHHTKQQALIGADNWWRKFFDDPKFRLQQELECYQIQLNSIKDRNLRFRTRLKVIDDLCSPMYGNIISKEELSKLLI